MMLTLRCLMKPSWHDVEKFLKYNGDGAIVHARVVHVKLENE